MDKEKIPLQHVKDPGVLLILLHGSTDLSDAPDSLLRHYLFSVKVDDDRCFISASSYGLNIDSATMTVSGTWDCWKNYIAGEKKDRELANEVFSMVQNTALRSTFNGYRREQRDGILFLIKK